MSRKYLFESERLGFRNWINTDVEIMAVINADPDVMEFFPSVKTHDETLSFIARMQQQMTDKGYCYFAVETLSHGELIGFIGLSEQTFEAGFTPCIDIGWRLSKDVWDRGYATEGARRCIDYAFNHLALPKVIAIAPKLNARSEHVMKKIGMKKVTEFIHPLLKDDEGLRECVVYEIERP